MCVYWFVSNQGKTKHVTKGPTVQTKVSLRLINKFKSVHYVQSNVRTIIIITAKEICLYK